MRLSPRSLIAASILCLASTALCAPKYKVLHSFSSGNDGGGLFGSLLVDGHRNVYGTTAGWGPYGGGTVFELTPGAGGTWTLTNLYNFCGQSGCSDGNASFAGVTSDNAGNLYGTTSDGGAYENGVVFEITRQSDGTWIETVRHSFHFGDYGGCCPSAGVTIDPEGNLYGTVGGAYELSPGSGGWTYDVLHVFTGQNGDGYFAEGVIRDTAGNLYGITEQGGTDKGCGGGCGTVYRLHPEPDGNWRETILYDFTSCDCAFPAGTLYRDAKHNLYGTTKGNNAGTVYRLNPEKGGHWRETTLHRFTAGAGGNDPAAGVVMGKSGELYGTTFAGGDPNCYCGVVFKLAPAKGGTWKYTVLHRFVAIDGAQPGASLILDSKGNLYGTTELGGTYNLGVAFELTP